MARGHPIFEVAALDILHRSETGKERNGKILFAVIDNVYNKYTVMGYEFQNISTETDLC